MDTCPIDYEMQGHNYTRNTRDQGKGNVNVIIAEEEAKGASLEEIIPVIENGTTTGYLLLFFKPDPPPEEP